MLVRQYRATDLQSCDSNILLRDLPLAGAPGMPVADRHETQLSCNGRSDDVVATRVQNKTERSDVVESRVNKNLAVDLDGNLRSGTEGRVIERRGLGKGGARACDARDGVARDTDRVAAGLIFVARRDPKRQHQPAYVPVVGKALDGIAHRAFPNNSLQKMTRLSEPQFHRSSARRPCGHHNVTTLAVASLGRRLDRCAFSTGFQISSTREPSIRGCVLLGKGSIEWMHAA